MKTRTGVWTLGQDTDPSRRRTLSGRLLRPQMDPNKVLDTMGTDQVQTDREEVNGYVHCKVMVRKWNRSSRH